jgi:hypothetical protein
MNLYGRAGAGTFNPGIETGHLIVLRLHINKMTRPLAVPAPQL